uniref:Uncharacterized protein isoform X4 n=2 Tax=Nicotiana TaxID=4085 RepID=A0A1S4BSW1_TOBAC|nr:PREDICTED: uncharacterized protein LOC104225446 isoform X2 [Nicotiana sylvestris]XP_016491969.1 PREDICTED: uncharacterized protein LOC107811528 isoform X4 [Nicotiana tabacum]
MENFDHRFQRTDQWMPVYSWLESLDTDEGPEFTNNMSLSEAQESEKVKKFAPPQIADNNLSTLPKDSELYKAKQTEARQKYEILVELEKQLLMHLPKPENIGSLREN